MIIYGWGNFNRREHSVVRGVCRACGRSGFLKSYTSSKFFTLYFIPLIPLGRQKIVSDCPHCKKSFGMPLRQWTKLRATGLPKAIDEYEKNPVDEDAAKSALGTIYSLQDRPSLRRIGPHLRTAFERNAGMLRLLAGTYSYLCMDKEADEAYLAAIGLSDAPDLAAEAKAHLDAQKAAKPRPPHRMLQSLPVLIVPGILTVLVAAWVEKAATSHVDNGYLVSGLSRAYSVTINGQTVRLRPFGRIAADMIRYGKNEIAPGPDSPFIAATSFAVNVPWYARPFYSSIVVVNPDQAAVVTWEQNGYAYPKAPDNSYQFRATSGSSSYTYDNIDYAFQDFPETVSVPSGGGITYKQRLAILENHEPQRIVQLLSSEKQDQPLRRYLAAKLRADDGGTSAIYLGSSLLPRGEFLALAEPRLAVRPVEIDWHRAYQDFVSYTPEGTDLESRYRGYVQTEPEDGALAYLLARIVENPAESRAILQAAVQRPHPSPYALNSLAYHALLDADFKTALEETNQALGLDPGNTMFRSMRDSARYGLRDFASVERETGDLLTADKADFTDFYAHVYRLGKLGQADQAPAEISRFLDRMQARSPLSAADRSAATLYLESALPIATDNRDAFVALASRGKSDMWAYEKAVIAGDLDGALALEKSKDMTMGPLDHLTLYVLLSQASRTDLAATELQKAITSLAASYGSNKRWAQWLKGDAAPDAAVATHVCQDIDNHCVYLVALAQKFPDHAHDYLARAIAMRNTESFYTLALASSLAP